MYDRSQGLAVTPEGTCCQSRDQQWNGVRAIKGVINKGKYYYEATVSDEGLCRVGWSLNEVLIFKMYKFSCLYLYSIPVFRVLWIWVLTHLALALVEQAKNQIANSLMIMERLMA